MTPEDIAPEFRTPPKSYVKPVPIEGVRILRPKRFTDDRGFFLEIFRAKADHPESRELVEFFQGVPVAQVNFSVVDAEGHIKGLHYHLKQDDVWFVPPPCKAKFVLYDVRKSSPTFGDHASPRGRRRRISRPHSRRLALWLPAADQPCALLYFVTATFDTANPDEPHPGTIRRQALWDVPNG